MILKEILDSGLGDYSLLSIEWTNGGHDLTFKLSSPREETLSLRFLWVFSLNIDIDFGQYSGSPLIFEAHFEPCLNSEWKAILQFGIAPEGHIQFQCHRIELA